MLFIYKDYNKTCTIAKPIQKKQCFPGINNTNEKLSILFHAKKRRSAKFAKV